MTPLHNVAAFFNPHENGACYKNKKKSVGGGRERAREDCRACGGKGVWRGRHHAALLHACALPTHATVPPAELQRTETPPFHYAADAEGVLSLIHISEPTRLDVI
eukprot:623124-Prorocentrum_lima.AAC.1